MGRRRILLLGLIPMFAASRPRLLDLWILIGGFIGSVLLVILSGWDGDWLVENGPLEMMQVGALFASMALFVRATASLGGWPGRLALALAFVSLLFLIRELPRCDSPFYAASVCFPEDSKTFAYFLPGVLAILLVILRPALRPAALRFAEFRTLPRFVLRCLPLMVVAILLAIGQFADSRGLPLLEETMELAGYCMLVLAGLAAAQESDTVRTNVAHGRAATVWATT